MSQDILADALNEIMNAQRAGKLNVEIKRHSKLLLNVLAIGKLKGYIKEYKVDGKNLFVEIGKLNYCRAVKPRFIVGARDIDKYVRRYLPGRGVGVVIVSTSKGLMTHQAAEEKKIGGGIISFFY